MATTPNTNSETRPIAGTPAVGLGARSAALIEAHVDEFATLDPTTITAEELAQEMLVLLEDLRGRILEGGEAAYVARRAALFHVESLSMALRRGRTGTDVPHEHAAVIDATYQKIQSTSSGVNGDQPDLGQLNEQVESRQQLFKDMLLQAGLLRQVPEEATEKKLTIAG